MRPIDFTLSLLTAHTIMSSTYATLALDQSTTILTPTAMYSPSSLRNYCPCRVDKPTSYTIFRYNAIGFLPHVCTHDSLPAYSFPPFPSISVHHLQNKPASKRGNKKSTRALQPSTNDQVNLTSLLACTAFSPC